MQLLDMAESDLRGGRAAVDLLDTAARAEKLGLGSALWTLASGGDRVEALRVQLKDLANDRSFSTKDKVASRKFVLTAYHYGGGDDTAAGPLTIVVRFPEDQKRERVKFTLKGLDLF